MVDHSICRLLSERVHAVKENYRVFIVLMKGVRYDSGS